MEEYPAFKLTSTEVTFERWRGAVGLFLGPLLGILVYALPMHGLSATAHTLAAVLTWVVVWWVTEPVPIPITALFGVVLCVLSGTAPANKAFAPLADPTIYLFLGSFIIAEAMSVHGLDRRFAYAIMSLRWAGGSAGRILFLYGAIAALISMWISNTATAAMMLPIGLGIANATARALKPETGGVASKHFRFGTGLMLMAAYAASAGGVGTPIGTPPNLIGIALIEKATGVRIAFFQWMLLALPCLLVLYFCLYGLLYLLNKPEVKRLTDAQEHLRRGYEELGPWTRGQKNTLVVFLVAIVLWTTPGFLALLFGADAPILKAYTSRLPEAVVALLSALLLFLLPVDWSHRQFTLTWRQASRIDWGTLILFGGGITLGVQMFETGLAEWVGQGLLALTHAQSPSGITMAAIVTAILVSETTSNTASANMVVPVMISLAAAAGVDPIPPAIGATLGASWGFMLPVSTPPNAIVYGSGLIPITRMIRAGAVFDVIGALCIWAAIQWWLPLIRIG
jgi:sodium-dependent dicarboxylate transporter 2/3/5